MLIREIEQGDMPQLLELYTHLHSNEMPKVDSKLRSLWDSIIKDKNHHIIVGIKDEAIVSSCVINIISNLTNHQRAYALVENVITHPQHCGNGYATKVLDYAKMIAKESNCYKIMLLTGSKRQATLDFYKRAGYNQNDKIAFIQWLD